MDDDLEQALARLKAFARKHRTEDVIDPETGLTGYDLHLIAGSLQPMVVIPQLKPRKNSP